MNTIFKYGSIEAIPLYDCSAHTPTEWSERDGVRHPIIGIIEITYGIVLNILYVPIITVMFEKQQFEMSCFKIMIFLAIVDMLALWVNSIITGFLAFQGAVFCTYPNLIYLVGMAGLGLWCCSCKLAMVLVINRLLDLTKPDLNRLLFNGNRTYLFLIISFIYLLYFMIFTSPIAFSSKYHTWFYDPLIFENRTLEYTNISHTMNNILVVSATCLLYVSFCFVLGQKAKQTSNISSSSSQTRKISIQIFFQSALICAVNQAASIVYVVMNFIEVPLWVVTVGNLMWQIGHGAPALIYLSLNKTIQNELLKKFKWKKTTVTVTIVNGFDRSL